MNFRGTISIKKEKSILFKQSYGYADVANQRKNQRETKFATASAGKVFVAVGILQLIEQKKLHFDDTIGQILTIDWQQIDTTITIRELLTHTSGIPDYFDESVMSDYDELWTDYPNYKIRSSQDLIPLFIHKPMMYPRGAKFQYNNTGFVVLGLIIEAITHQSFDEYLQQHVFNVAQMPSTGYYELDCLPANCANHYVYDEKRQRYVTNIYSVDVKGTGAGGAFTTVDDIEAFWEALLGYRLLSKEMTDEMLRVQARNDQDHYGYGIWLTEESIPYFCGSDPGVSFMSSYDVNTKTIVTLFSNFSDNVWSLHREIRESLS
ncbi:serine hydrolase [Turicibacter sanguinis]|nr:serine hydrolase [Turicibacter sanguinis]